LLDRIEPDLYAVRTPPDTPRVEPSKPLAPAGNPAPADAFAAMRAFESARRSLGAAYLYLLLFGWAGVHRLYTGRPVTGAATAILSFASLAVLLFGFLRPAAVAIHLGPWPGHYVASAALAILVAVICAYDFISLPQAVTERNLAIINALEAESDGNPTA
jgi:hypothetical protein